jgi:hypothetical protein
MVRILASALFCAGLTLMVMSAGCQQQKKDAPKAEKKDAAKDEHAHPTEGPHHGSLIELGNEEYHAELLHDEKAGKVTIYVLDGEAKKTVPIPAKELTINLKHGGKGEQFKLAAAPDMGDPEGKSSRFMSEDKELAEDLDAEGAEARLVVEINGKSYTGDLAHEHDHDHKHK